MINNIPSSWSLSWYLVTIYSYTRSSFLGVIVVFPVASHNYYFYVKILNSRAHTHVERAALHALMRWWCWCVCVRVCVVRLHVRHVQIRAHIISCVPRLSNRHTSSLATIVCLSYLPNLRVDVSQMSSFNFNGERSWSIWFSELHNSETKGIYVQKLRVKWRWLNFRSFPVRPMIAMLASGRRLIPQMIRF